eukprot:COSAG06_NODE_35229_length_462_cov_1.548209_1_plen_91_part_00
MVYGELGRRGIYDFHDMYRLLGVRRNPALARKLVAALPETSWLKKNKNMLTGDFDKFGDSGVTDLLVSDWCRPASTRRYPPDTCTGRRMR